MTNTVPLTHLTPEEVKAVLSEYRINSADIAFRCDATVDDLIDVLEGMYQAMWSYNLGNRVYTSCIYVMNKIDQISIEELDLIYKVPHAGKIGTWVKFMISTYFCESWVEF